MNYTTIPITLDENELELFRDFASRQPNPDNEETIAKEIILKAIDPPREG